MLLGGCHACVHSVWRPSVPSLRTTVLDALLMGSCGGGRWRGER